MHNSLLFEIDEFENGWCSIYRIDLSEHRINSFQYAADNLHIEGWIQKWISIVVQCLQAFQLFITLLLPKTKLLWLANGLAYVVQGDLPKERTRHHPKEKQNASGLVNYKAYMLPSEQSRTQVEEEVGLQIIKRYLRAIYLVQHLKLLIRALANGCVFIFQSAALINCWYCHCSVVIQIIRWSHIQLWSC